MNAKLEELDFKLWELAACGSHSNRYCEDDKVWDTACIHCVTNKQKLTTAYRLGREDADKWLKLYAAAREAICCCNKTNTPERGPLYDYTCEWCTEHPEGNWAAVETALKEGKL